MKHNIALVLDTASRSKMHIDTMDMVYKGAIIASSLDDISIELLEDKNTTVFLLEWFCEDKSNLIRIKVLQTLSLCRFIYLGQNTLWLNVMRNFVTAFNIDCNNISYDKLMQLVFGEGSKEYENISDVNKLDTQLKLAHSIIESNTESKEVKILAEGFIVRTEELFHLSLNYNKLQTELANLSSRLCTVESENAFVYNSYSEIITESQKVDVLLKQYGVSATTDFYDKVDLTRYPNRPLVIYIKEYEELNHLNSLALTLYNMLLFQMKMSAKVLYLFDSSASKRLLRLPPTFVQLKDSYSKTDLYNNNFLAKIGNYQKTFDILLSELPYLNVLLVVDCKDHSDITLTGNVIRFNTVRNLKRCDKYFIPKENTINNSDENHDLYWGTFQGYDKLNNDHDKMLFLSGKQCIQTIFDIVSRYKEVR